MTLGSLQQFVTPRVIKTASHETVFPAVGRDLCLDVVVRRKGLHALR